MRIALIVGLVTLSGLVGGCADECDVGVTTLLEQCGIDVMRDEDAECTSENEEYFRCVNAHPAAACDYFFDPVENADNAFGQCLGEP